MTRAPAFKSWLDNFFAAYCRRLPVNATFIGIHNYDDRLPDYSPDAVGGALDDVNALLERLRTLPDEQLTAAEMLDRKLAEGFLEIQRWEVQSGHFQSGNPCLYTSETAFGVIGLLRRPFAPAGQRLEAAIRRMEAVPNLLQQGRANVRTAPHWWTERAIDECAGALALFDTGIHEFMRERGISEPLVDRAAARARTAVAEFQHYLETDLRANSTEGCACGAEAFALLLRKGHFVETGAADFERYALEQLAGCEAFLTSHAGDFGARTWQEALAQLACLHPSADRYYSRYSELWQDCRSLAEQNHLLTWPDCPIRYVPRPRWAREAAPHLYFLFYHSPAPFDALPDHEYLVTPIDATMPPDMQEQLLRATNDSVIKLNHVVHHGAIGHHVQNRHAFRAESLVGRIAAVDCASRIALFCGGTMAEGWACYATDLMDEFGFLTPLEHYSQIHARMRMAARAVVDVRLHHGRITLEQAAAFYRDRVGMTAAAARSEAVKNSMFPGAALMYLAGTDAIHGLRHELERRPGFRLSSFHDRLLSFGSAPVALAAESMKNVIAETQSEQRRQKEI